MARKPADGAALREHLRHVFWIGGGSGAGKSSIARRIAAQLGLRVYATDEVMADHARRGTKEDSPLLHTFMAMDMDEDARAKVLRTYRDLMFDLARRPNVHCKVGGLGMPFWGFRFEERQDPIGYEELATAWRPYVETAIEAFGADRCMMESNYPMDGRSGGFVPIWNALKHIVRAASPDEKDALFHGTAARVYRISEARPR